MIKKFPLIRGKSKNKSVSPKTQSINLSDLNRITDITEIDMKVLIEKGYIRDDAVAAGVKILGLGEIKRAVIVRLPVSKVAREKIEKAGGKIV